jgi:phage terminase large subunit-like protein
LSSSSRINLSRAQLQAKAFLRYHELVLAEEKESEEKQRYEREIAEQYEKYGTFRNYIKNVEPRYPFHPHNEKLIDVLQRVADGEIMRLMVFEPPRHYKSQTASRLFPGYYQWKHKQRSIGLTTHADSLSFGLSRKARDYYQATGRVVKQDASSPREWHTQDDGIMWAVGRGGSITGKGAHLLLIDDPIKGFKEAQSDKIRNDLLEWYDSDFYTRLEPDGAIIIIQTRWHEADLAGMLLEREEYEPERWHIVNFEARKEQKPTEFPDTCTVEPDERVPGEALCAAIANEEKLDKIERKNSRVFLSLYQQRPTSPEGNLWKRSWFPDENIFDLESKPQLIDEGTDWDTAYTQDEENAASAYVRAGWCEKNQSIYVTDLDFEWFEFPDLIKWMKRTKGPHNIEKKASGKSAAQTLKRSGIKAKEVPVDGGNDKIARTTLVTWIAEEKRIYVARHIVSKLLDDEQQGILKFPNGKHKDLNDAFVQMINRLLKHAKRSSDRELLSIIGNER